MPTNKKNLFCGITISLLLVIIGAMVVNFAVLGKTEEGVDGRTAILLTEGERVEVLGEMREFLSAVQILTTAVVNEANDALPSEDMDTIAKTARGVGQETVEAMAPAMFAKLPLEFKTLGFSVHDDFRPNRHRCRRTKRPSTHAGTIGGRYG